MLFNSFSFLIFFPVVTLLYFALPHRWRWTLLLSASVFFYMVFVPAYILILGILIVIDYFAGRWIEQARPERKKVFLIISIIATCSVLFFFKYFDFFAGNIGSLARLLGWNYSLDLLGIALPLGLSFHTFQSLSYVIEVYRGQQKAEHHFGYYSLYVMFYPQLVAGPIERPQHLLPQLHTYHHFEYQRVVSGLQRILWGLFKKMVIADRLAFFVGPVFDHPANYDGVSLLAATIYFAIQIYCDFSGYVDIALGSAKVMGIKLTENFHQPYLARSVSEFWRRWHISLSSWVRDYIFLPLALQLRSWGLWGIVGATLATFTILGLWHGANWTFLVFGILHGLAISIELLTKKIREKLASKANGFLIGATSLVYTFAFWSFSLIFFRAKSLSDAFYIASHLFSGLFDYIIHIFHYTGSAGSGLLAPLLAGQHREDFVIMAGAILLLLIVEIFPKRVAGRDLETLFSSRLPNWFRWSAYYALIFIILLYGVFYKTPFIYFQF